MTRKNSGTVNHYAGIAAESAVATHYLRAGFSIVARRWRGLAGEIDLIMRGAAGLVFIEVKKARNFGCAAERVTPRKAARLYQAASEFLSSEPDGLNTHSRFDLAVVNAAGEIGVLENAIGH